MAAIASRPEFGIEARAAAAQTLVTLNPESNAALLEKIVSNPEEPEKLREKTTQSLSKANTPAARTALIAAMQGSAQRLRTQIALHLASNPEGAESLLKAIEEKKLSGHVLREVSIRDRLAATKPQQWQERLERATQGLPPLSKEKQKLIESRTAAFTGSRGSVSKGKQVFLQNCGICHQLGGEGALVGPQLDGMGNRGAERIIEDILDPNRNVDHAFRYSTVTLKDEQVITGLFRREEGQLLIFADATGREISVPRSEIVEQVESENSLMPDNFDETISPEDFNDLIAFLLSK